MRPQAGAVGNPDCSMVAFQIRSAWYHQTLARDLADFRYTVNAYAPGN